MIGIIPDDAGCWGCGELEPEYLVAICEAADGIPFQIHMLTCSSCGDQIQAIVVADPTAARSRLFTFLSEFPVATRRMDFALRTAERCTNGLVLALYQRHWEWRFTLIDPVQPYGIDVASGGN